MDSNVQPSSGASTTKPKGIGMAEQEKVGYQGNRNARAVDIYLSVISVAGMLLASGVMIYAVLAN